MNHELEKLKLENNYLSDKVKSLEKHVDDLKELHVRALKIIDTYNDLVKSLTK